MCTKKVATGEIRPKRPISQVDGEAELGDIKYLVTFLKPQRALAAWISKEARDGTLVKRFKARIVACGYSQIGGLDYDWDSIYAPTLSSDSMRTFLFCDFPALLLPIFW